MRWGVFSTLTDGTEGSCIIYCILDKTKGHHHQRKTQADYDFVRPRNSIGIFENHVQLTDVICSYYAQLVGHHNTCCRSSEMR
jgi:hypothetical protein